MRHPGGRGRFVGLRLALRGIAYRRLTAIVVLVLAVVAATAAVVAPLYSRAAEESIARGTLARSDVFARAVHADVSANAARVALPPSGTIDSLRRRLKPPVFGTPRLSATTESMVDPTAGPQAGGQVEVPLLDREGLCEHLVMSSGRCPTRPDEAALTTRSMKLLGLQVGSRFSAALVDVQRPDGSQQVARLTVVGTAEPFDLDDDYWVGRPMFRYYPISRPSGLSELPPLTDAVWLGHGAAKALGVQSYSVDVPVDGRAVGLDDGPAVAAAVTATTTDLGKVAVSVTSQLPQLIEGSNRRSDVVRVAAPLAAFQLVLLAWVILAHVVGSATQERAPELGLAKLRGLTPPRTVRFGLGEVSVLLLVSAPIGTLLGWWVVHLVATHLLEPGIELRVGPTVVASVLLGVVGGLAAAAVAARSVARGHVSDLLRRVPGAGRGRRAGAVEGIVLALVAAGVVQLAVTRGSTPGPVASAAPGMIALGGALLAARVLRSLSRRRAERALERGRPSALVGWAGVARRAGTARTTGVLTAALCLLLVGVQAWTVAARERQVRALAETGAPVVLSVRAPEPGTLLRAVRAADPSGRYAMAVMEQAGSNTASRALAVDADRADAVMGFSGRGPAHVSGVLRPTLPASFVLRPGPVTADVSVQSVESATPMVLSVTVESASGWQEVDLGALRVGDRTYRGVVPSSCADGCRVVGLAVRHAGTDITTGRASLQVRGIAASTGSATGPLDAQFDRPAAWRAAVPDSGGASSTVKAGRALAVEVSTPGGFPARVIHGDAPEPLPALTGSGAAVRDGLVAITGADGGPASVRRAGTAPFVPGLGRAGVVIDLDLALRSVPTASSDSLQVWLGRDDPAAERTLTSRLAASGVQVTDRASAQQALEVLNREGAVLALLLFLACGAVAVLVALGAVLVAAFVGSRQRAGEVAALRAVGVRRPVLRRAMLVENLAGVGVAVGCAVVAAAVTVLVVLPVLPLADEDSDVVVASTAPALVPGVWSVLGVSVLLAVVAVLLASAQLRGGSVDRIREAGR
ncbi:MAG: FtsX-like permease family protein [Angustibacter sp.]